MDLIFAEFGTNWPTKGHKVAILSNIFACPPQFKKSNENVPLSGYAFYYR